MKPKKEEIFTICYFYTNMLLLINLEVNANSSVKGPLEISQNEQLPDSQHVKSLKSDLLIGKKKKKKKEFKGLHLLKSSLKILVSAKKNSKPKQNSVMHRIRKAEQSFLNLSKKKPKGRAMLEVGPKET